MVAESPKQVDDSVARSREESRQWAWGDRSPRDEDTIDLSRFVLNLKPDWNAVLNDALGFDLASLRPFQYECVTTLLVVPLSPPNDLQASPAAFRVSVANVAKQVVEGVRLQAALPRACPSRSGEPGAC